MDKIIKGEGNEEVWNRNLHCQTSKYVEETFASKDMLTTYFSFNYDSTGVVYFIENQGRCMWEVLCREGRAEVL